MYHKKYIIEPNIMNPRALETEIWYDGDHLTITQTDKDTGHYKEMFLSEDEANDIREIITEILERGE